MRALTPSAFNIPRAGVHTITPISNLPEVTDQVVIDGYTQPGSSPNTLAAGDNAVLLIELNGTLGGLVAGITDQRFEFALFGDS